MLDHEPENNHENTPDTPAETSSETKPAPRRRRAATRPAGPPSTPVAEEPAATAAPTDPAAEAAPTEAPAEKPVRRSRRTTKKTAETAPDQPVEESADGAAAAPPRARRSRKKAAPAPVAEEPVAEEPVVEEPVVEEPVTEEPVVEEPVTEEPVVEGSLFIEPVFEQPAAAITEVAPEASPADGGDAEARAADPEQTDESGESDESDDEDENSDEGGAGNRRRRRRRGGRRRRRGGSDADASESDRKSDDESDAEGKTETQTDGQAERGSSDSDESESDAENDAEGDADGDSDGSGGRRRRRRRRRRGEDAGSSPDDPTEVVVRVREPRPSRRSGSDAPEGISGSTRLEAKRQRRREGREAGRRRAPILSEAEFLARRESVNRKMIIRQRDDLSQIAVIEDDILVEHYVDRDSAASLIGNVYLGRVQNVLPSMEAAFIDIGRGRNAVLYAGEVDWASFGAEGQQRKVESVLKSGNTVLVQVTKDPVGAKGARLTNHVSVPGRYVVYAPGGHLSGISRKLPDVERKRLKGILSELVPESASVIVRTAAEGASEEELVRDVNRLKAQWADIEKKVKAGSAPQLLYAEPDLTLRIVRDLFTEDFGELIIQGSASSADAYDAVEGYVAHVAPHLKDRLRRWDVEADGDLFGAYRLDEQISKGLERKVFLPSGGSLVIDRTEAMTVIDVNTGKFTGSGGNLEATVTSNNLEAAEEVVRQLRLRDIGGIIVIDFIDMVLPSNRELLLRRLVECLGRDRTRHQVAEVTSLGLVQMTRKKIGTGLLEAFSTECTHCGGRGYEVHDLPVETQKQPDGGARDNNRGRRNERPSRGRIPKELKPDLSSPKPEEPKPEEPKPEEPKPEEPMSEEPKLEEQASEEPKVEEQASAEQGSDQNGAESTATAEPELEPAQN